MTEVAQLSQALDARATSEMRILPAGLFRSQDGRPHGLTAWNIDAEIAQSVIAASMANRSELLIDYEHQSLLAVTNGQPVPAAGWFSGLEWRDGVGLYALGIRWNEKAKSMIAAREYRYISPVFTFDSTGNISQVLSVAITNNPALPWLTDLSTIAMNSAKLTSIRNVVGDPRNQRGEELLARMNSQADEIAARTGQKSAWLTEADLAAIGRAPLQDQRGLELLARMNTRR